MTKQEILDNLTTMMGAADPADVPRFQKAITDASTLPEDSPLLVHYHPGDPPRELWLPPPEIPSE